MVAMAKLFVRPHEPDSDVDAINERQRPAFEERLAQSISEFGLWCPLLVLRTTIASREAFQIIDGVSRFNVLKALGAVEAPVEFFEFPAGVASEELKRIEVRIQEINRRLDKRWDERCDGLVVARLAAGTSLSEIASDFGTTRREIESAVARSQGRSFAPLWARGGG